MPLRVRVCRLADVVPGELRAFDVEGVTWPVIVTYVDGAMAAFPGVCPHDDVSLGECEHVPSLHLRRYKITMTGDEVWVDLL